MAATPDRCSTLRCKSHDESATGSEVKLDVIGALHRRVFDDQCGDTDGLSGRRFFVDAVAAHQGAIVAVAQERQRDIDAAGLRATGAGEEPSVAAATRVEGELADVARREDD